MVLKFQSLIWELERQMPPGEFDSEKFEAVWVQLNWQGTKILTVLSKRPTNVWPETLAHLKEFRKEVKRLVETCYWVGQPESVAKNLALCNLCAAKVYDRDLLLFNYVHEPEDGPEKVEEPAGDVAKTQVRPKRSTSNGGARVKIIAFLTKHHEYANGSLLDQTPIGVNDLAGKAMLSKGSVSKFFKDKFGNHEIYKKACRDSGTLIVALKALNNEFTPKLLFKNARPQVDAPDE